MKLILSVAFFLIVRVTLCQGVNEEINITNEYQSVCYCISNDPTDYTPSSILRIDNNRKIIWAIGNGRRREDLTSIDISGARIDQMLAWNLLKEESSLLKTNFPIIDRERASIIERVVARNISQISESIAKDVVNLRNELSRLKHKNVTFSFLFSYILNGKVFNELENRGLIHLYRKSNRLIWEGEFWVIKNGYSQTYKTTSLSYDNNSLLISWNKESASKMKTLFEDWSILEGMLKEITINGKIDNSKLNPSITSVGDLILPIIDENSNDQLMNISEMITRKVTDQLSKLPVDAIVEVCKLRDRQQGIVVLYHELIWALINDLVKRQLIDVPDFFKNPGELTSENIDQMFFVLKHKI